MPDAASERSNQQPPPTSVMTAYAEQLQTTVWESLGNAGGFSGARLWRLETQLGPQCLRRWPTEHPSAEQLTWLHGVLAEITAAGFRLLPVPHRDRNGRRFQSFDGHLWELTPWLPGMADFDDAPSVARFENAIGSLAEFHRAASTSVATPHELTSLAIGDTAAGRSPGVEFRRKQVDQLLSGRLQQLQTAVSRGMRSPAAPVWRECGDVSLAILRRVADPLADVADKLRWLASQQRRLHPCLRDIWSAHVLFTGEAVSGIIDVGAMRNEWPHLDLARLMGSLEQPMLRAELFSNRTALWDHGFKAYQNRTGASDDEKFAILVLDEANRCLSGISWIQWLWADSRRFDDMSQVCARLRLALSRLEESRV